jgi:hypothetical protein
MIHSFVLALTASSVLFRARRGLGFSVKHPEVRIDRLFLGIGARFLRFGPCSNGLEERIPEGRNELVEGFAVASRSPLHELLDQ